MFGTNCEILSHSINMLVVYIFYVLRGLPNSSVVWSFSGHFHRKKNEVPTKGRRSTKKSGNKAVNDDLKFLLNFVYGGLPILLNTMIGLNS